MVTVVDDVIAWIPYLAFGFTILTFYYTSSQTRKKFVEETNEKADALKSEHSKEMESIRSSILLLQAAGTIEDIKNIVRAVESNAKRITVLETRDEVTWSVFERSLPQLLKNFDTPTKDILINKLGDKSITLSELKELEKIVQEQKESETLDPSLGLAATITLQIIARREETLMGREIKITGPEDDEAAATKQEAVAAAGVVVESAQATVDAAENTLEAAKKDEKGKKEELEEAKSL